MHENFIQFVGPLNLAGHGLFEIKEFTVAQNMCKYYKQVQGRTDPEPRFRYLDSDS